MEIYQSMQRDSAREVNTVRFLGLNRNRKAGNGELEDMLNMTSAEYPCAAPAPSRVAVVATTQDIQAVAAPDGSVSDSVSGFTGIMGGSFYYNGVKKSGKTVLGTDMQWSIVRLNTVYIINGVGAEHKAAFTYNADTDVFQWLTGHMRVDGSFRPAYMDKLIVTAGEDGVDGNFIETYTYRTSEVSEYEVTLDDGSNMKGYEFYSAYGSPEKDSNIFSGYFNVGDIVEIGGFPPAGNSGRLWYYTGGSGDTGDVVEVTNYDVSMNNTVDTTIHRLSNIDRDAIVKAQITKFEVIRRGSSYGHRVYFNLVDKTGTANDFRSMLGLGTGSANYYAQGVKIWLSYPALQDTAVHDGRLWGTAVNGESVYGSAKDNIGDFTDASINEGIVERLVPDTPGKFTGLCEYGSYLLAFKEDCMFICYGTPYRVETMQGIGCIDPKSIAATPQGVIFLSYKGFYIYSGSTPRLISSPLNTIYTSATAGFDGNVYYASALRADGVREMLAYDMRYGLWHIRDDFEAVGMFRFKSNFYFADSRHIYTETGDPDEWSFTLAQTTDNTLDSKTVNELWIYAYVYDNADFTVYTNVSDGGWRQHSTFDDTGLKLYRCPIRALSGTNYRIRIDGHGKVVFYEIEVKESDQTGRRYKER